MSNDFSPVYRPKIVITTSRRKSPLTNTFIKALSSVLGAFIIRRGTSNLDEIALNAKETECGGIIIVYTRMGNPSVLTFLKITENGYYKLFGRMFLLGVHINRTFRGHYEYIRLLKKCSSKACEKTYDFLRNFFSGWEIEDVPENYKLSNILVKELEEYRESWLRKFADNPKFSPSTIEILDHKSNILIRLRVHHVWISE